MHRFFVDAAAVGPSDILIDGDDIKHIRKVLRLKEGDRIEVSDSASWEYLCEIASLEERLVTARILDKQRFSREPELEITLFQGVAKGDRMEQVIQKSTELGVHRIVPVFMARSVVVDNGKFGKKIARYNTIAQAAAKQCRRGRIPEVAEAVKMKEVPAMLSEFDRVLLPYENETTTSLKQCLRNGDRRPKKVAVIIGPEGGFADEEATMICEAGGESVSLGKTILRTENAGPTTIAMCMYEWEMDA